MNIAVLAANPKPWSGNCVVNGVATIEGLECLFSNLLNVATTLAGIVFGIMLIVGGFKFIFAGGNPEGVKSAQNTLTFAVIGLVVMIGAWFVLLLIKQFTGVDVTEFNIQ